MTLFESEEKIPVMRLIRMQRAFYHTNKASLASISDSMCEIYILGHDTASKNKNERKRRSNCEVAAGKPKKAVWSTVKSNI